MPDLKLSRNRDRSDDPKPWPRGALVALAVTTGAFAAGFTACTYVVATWRPKLNFAVGADLKPIPVPRASCPYLRRVHDTAADAGRASGAVEFDSDANTWRASQFVLAGKLGTFDLALQSAAAHSPGPIAANLLYVHRQVGIGLTQLRLAQTGSDWGGRTSGAIMNGYRSLGEASDLTGGACGFTVVPSPDVFLDPGTGQA